MRVLHHICMPCIKTGVHSIVLGCPKPFINLSEDTDVTQLYVILVHVYPWLI